MFTRGVWCLLDMRPLTNSPPEVIQAQGGTLVHVLGFWALWFRFNVKKMLQFYTKIKRKFIDCRPM